MKYDKQSGTPVSKAENDTEAKGETRKNKGNQPPATTGNSTPNHGYWPTKMHVYMCLQADHSRFHGHTYTYKNLADPSIVRRL